MTRTPDRTTRFEAHFIGGPRHGEKMYSPKVHDEVRVLLPLTPEAFRDAIDARPEMTANGVALYRLVEARGDKVLFYRFAGTN